MVARFLVTTALEETWPSTEVPVLFLGEWCRLYGRKSAWAKRDAVVEPYHWDDRNKLHKDYLYLQTLYEELLEELAFALNSLHCVDHSLRYWRIVVGSWLGCFLQIAFDRWAMLQQNFSRNDILGVRVIRRNTAQFVPNDRAEFTNLFVSDDWNEWIYGQILKQMRVPVEEIDVEPVGCLSKKSGRAVSQGLRWKQKLARGISHLSGMLCREDEYFFMSSYLPIKQDLLLQAKLGQLPKLWRPVEAPVSSFNPASRKWRLPEQVDNNEFSSIVRALIPAQIPKAYVEGYRDLTLLADKMPWPKKPKAIFTSNSYDSDEIFKLWAGSKVQSGVPLVIGQHGGNYGVALWNFGEEHQIAISDSYITWGWSNPNNLKTVPIGILKGVGASVSRDKKGLALLVEMIIPRQSYWMYSAPVASGQWEKYFEEQVRFVNALPLDLRNQLLVRLDALDCGHCQQQRWKAHLPETQIDDGIQPIKSLLQKSRIYISTYNATTFLESLSLNFPTIIFWDPRYWELRDSALPYFEELKSIGIFHETPESAAEQLARVWEDIDTWWLDPKLQTIRQSFCNEYARIPTNPLDLMQILFRDVAESN